jgi:hypothetical protein
MVIRACHIEPLHDPAGVGSVKVLVADLAGCVADEFARNRVSTLEFFAFLLQFEFAGVFGRAARAGSALPPSPPH